MSNANKKKISEKKCALSSPMQIIPFSFHRNTNFLVIIFKFKKKKKGCNCLDVKGHTAIIELDYAQPFFFLVSLLIKKLIIEVNCSRILHQIIR